MLLLLLSCSLVFSSLWSQGLQHARLPCPSLSAGVSSDSRPLSWKCYLNILSSATLFSFCLQYFPASGFFSNESALQIRWPKYWSPPCMCHSKIHVVIAVELLTCVQLFVIPRITARQASLSFTICWSFLGFTSIELEMLSKHLILCHPLLLLPSILPSIRVFFQWVSSSNQVAEVLELKLQHQPFQWILRLDFC